VAGVRGLELGNVALIACRPNPLVRQNIFVPESFGEEPQRDGRGSLSPGPVQGPTADTLLLARWRFAGFDNLKLLA
jgi:hypothetical protein